MYPNVNQHINIKINNEHSCKSVVAEIGDNELYISFPMDRAIIGMLSFGSVIEISYIVEGNRYIFKSEIIGRKVDPIPLMKLSKPKETSITKIQLREFFRVSAFLNVKIKDQDFITSNISAGGLLFNCDVDFDVNEGELVTGTLFIPHFEKKMLETISFIGEIKRIMIVKEIEKKNVSVEFLNMSQREQSKIQQYCFAKQRQQRSKGL